MSLQLKKDLERPSDAAAGIPSPPSPPPSPRPPPPPPPPPPLQRLQPEDQW